MAEINNFWIRVNQKAREDSFSIDAFDRKHYISGPARIAPKVAICSDPSDLRMIGWQNTDCTMFRRGDAPVSLPVGELADGWLIHRDDVDLDVLKECYTCLPNHSVGYESDRRWPFLFVPAGIKYKYVEIVLDG